MQQITLCNVHQNNLKIETISIPLHTVVVFCGPSGSGKSSLAIDTILAEGQRRCVEALRSSIRLDEKRLSRPKAESIEGLPPTFGMKQDLGEKYDRHATLSDLFGLQILLEHLYLQHGQLHCPETGEKMKIFSPQTAANTLLEMHEGCACYIVFEIECKADTYKAILEELRLNGHTRIQYNDEFILIEDSPTNPPNLFGVVLDRLKLKEKNLDRLKEALKRGLSSHNQQVNAITTSKSKNSVTEIFSAVPRSSTGRSYQKPSWQHLQSKTPLGCCPKCKGLGSFESSISTIDECTKCNGTGLGPYATMLKINGTSFQDMMRMPPTDILGWIEAEGFTGGEANEIKRTLKTIIQLNLDKPLSHKINNCSTGERSRARICSVINQDLGQCLYILDEPSLGLDNENVNNVISLLKEKVTEGQSFIVVDHHPLFATSFDTLFHFGPGSGIFGGQILKRQPTYDLLAPDEFEQKQFAPLTQSSGSLPQLYKGAIHVISGPSGCGKSLLLRKLHHHLKENRDERILFLHSLGSLGNKRSTLVTISGMWSEIRTLMASTKSAKLNRLKAADFSFNRKGGRCETCLGIGSIPHHVAPLPPTEIQCPDCMGQRFSEQTLLATYRDKTISQILNLSVDEALKLFEHQPTLHTQCLALQMVGLGYLTLGQTSPTLSGGEHRRIQLAQVLSPCLKPDYKREPLIVLMDDPSAALHASDAVKLQRCLLNFRRKGITMIATSNNRQFIDIADVKIELN